MKQQSGFTLVELVVVIAVLGILAATALPRFVNIQGNANRAAATSLAGTITSAANLARASWIAGGSTGTTVVMDGITINVGAAGWPTLASISDVLQDSGGFTESTADSGVFTKAGTACTVSYVATTGQASIGNSC